MKSFEAPTDIELIGILQRRGYVVRHSSEVRHPLSWNRREPLPNGCDFKAEAVEKIRALITPELLRFSTREAQGMKPGTTETIHTAALLVL